MKRLLLILFLFASVLAFSQDTKPVSANFKQLQTPNNTAFYYFTTDSSVWVYKGTYGWTKLANANIKYSIWNHTGIKNAGWTTAKVLGFDSGGNIIPVAAGAGSMIYPSSGIAVSNGSAWVASISDNSSNWNTVVNRKLISDSTAIDGYTRRDRLASQLATREPKFTHGTNLQYFKGDLTLGTFPTQLSAFTNNLGNYGSFLVASDISGKENSSNKVTSISGVSTDVQYPSAKLLYDQLATKQGTGSYLVAADITGKKDISDSTATTGYTRRDRLASQIATREPKFTHGTTGQYFRGDLSLATFPTIPAAQIQSDWTQASTGALDFIKNKPSIPTQYTDAMADARVVAGITGKQNTLVSGTNIRTVNGNTLLGSTDLVIGGSMTWPLGSGIPIVSTGSSWGTTISNGTGFLKNNGTGTYSYDNSTYVTGTPWTGMGYLTGNQSITLSGDVSGTGTTAITTAIGSNKVTLGMMSQMATSSFLGRNTAATGNVEVLSVATAKTMLGLGSAAYTPSTDYATSSHNLGSHSDVIISSPTTGDYFGYQGGSWGNHPLLIGSTSGLPIITTTSGILSAGSFSNTAGTFAEGNHTHSIYAALAGSMSQNFNVATLGIEAGSNDWSVSGSAGVLNFTSYSASIAFGTTGNITASNFTLSSDRRLKQNIRPITFSNSNQIRFVNYEMKADSTHRTRYGVIAQDIERIMPEAVYTDEKGIKSVDYTAILIAKISELENRIKQLENGK